MISIIEWFRRIGINAQSPFKVEAAFSTRLQAVLFLSILSITIIWPFLEVRAIHAEPGNVYKNIPQRSTYRYIGNQINGSKDVDILLVGGSDMWTAIDPRIVEEELGKRLDRDIRVLNLSNNWAGFESYYARVSDFLRNNNVKLVIFPHQDNEVKFHALAKYVWRPGHHRAPKTLSVSDKLSLYAIGMVGAPIRLWGYLRGPDNVEINSRGKAFLDMAKETGGFLSSKRPFRSLRADRRQDQRPYREMELDTPAFSARALTFRPGNDRFIKYESNYNEYQQTFLRATHRLVKRNGGRFAMLSIPIIFDDKPLEKAMVRQIDDEFKNPWPDIGIAMADLFDGLTFDQMLDFYANERHLNPEGAKVFSRALTPVLAKLLR